MEIYVVNNKAVELGKSSRAINGEKQQLQE